MKNIVETIFGKIVKVIELLVFIISSNFVFPGTEYGPESIRYKRYNFWRC